MPVVAVHNNLETFYPFLSRSEDTGLLEKRRYRGDRCLFWLGDPKLVFVTAPIAHAEAICQRWGYPGTRVLAPRMSTPQLCRDILREPNLLDEIVSYAGPGRTIQLIPYATTPEMYELVDALRRQRGLTVLLPESPAPELLWLRDHIDTKTGFRSLVPRWVPDPELLPLGMICSNPSQAAQAAGWFFRRGMSCVVKAHDGESGLGHLVLDPAEISAGEIPARLASDPFLRRETIVVEQFIHSSANLSPSLELFVPAAGEGQPQITYLSQQVFETFGRFSGVLISRDLLGQDWYPLLAECGLEVARQLQAMGYVGHFDLDTIIDDDGRLHLLETNARRTGGTFVHEFARHTFGADYLERVAVLSGTLPTAGIVDFPALLRRLDDLLFPNGKGAGVVVTVTSALLAGEVGCIFVAPDVPSVLRLRQQVQERLAK